MAGFIKLHRKFLQWEWYSDLNTRVMFLHLILRASHEDNIWKGIPIKRGQLITSLENLASEVGISKQQVRNTLTKLKRTREITLKTTNKFSLITLCNYDFYQSKGSSQHANQHEKNTQTNNRQEEKKKRIKYIVGRLNEILGTHYKSDSKVTVRHISARIDEGFSNEDFENVIITKFNDWQEDKRMKRYLRPETLFGPKFESYLNEKINQPKKKLVL